MTSFRTEIIPQPSLIPLSYLNKIVTIGSCFADQIGARLENHKFHCSINPVGTVYHPIAIHDKILWGLGLLELSEKHFARRDEVWNHFDFHSRWGALDETTLRNQLMVLRDKFNSHLTQASAVIITYGTAWGYRYTETNKIIANCHKVPQQKFYKELSSIENIFNSFCEMREKVMGVNPSIKFILTVSPVRYVRDTLELNQVSKSILRVVCHEVTAQFKNTVYFPSYEIMIDDLRDYRFYEKDLIHPNEIAIDYLWEKFSLYYFEPETIKLIRAYADIRIALNHRPFHPDGVAHQKFLKSLLKKTEQLGKYLPLEKEIQTIQSQIKYS